MQELYLCDKIGADLPMAFMGDSMFYQTLAVYYDSIFPPERNKTAFLHREFAAVGASRVLDLACGTGAYAVELSRLGYEAWGMDLEPALIEQAQKKAADAKAAARFIVGDMREPSAPGQLFDGLFCIGNSLAHLLEASDLRKALAAMRRVLNSPGRDVFQIVNFDRILALGDTKLPLMNGKA
ncbi:MAG: Glycine/sarcosine N-methyltransferase [Syntrophomonadaceae bacterium]|nr:Glycine/sarcosine N-methyltransferase [Bacillota bacterium]